MQSDVDWVGRDLQRLAGEKKLLRTPTEAEWRAIWRAATEWADAYGVVATGMPIDEFVRKHAPGVLGESTAQSSTNPQVGMTVASASGAGTGAGVVEPPKTDPRERGRRYPRITGRAKTARPAAG